MTITKRKLSIRTVLVVLVAGLALSLAACKKEADPDAAAAVKAPLSAPTTNDDQAWQAYVTDVVTRNMGNITRSPYVYYLPVDAAAEAEPAAAPAATADKPAGDDAPKADQSVSAIGTLSIKADSEYARLLQKAQDDIGRGILSGNMLAFASPDSASMADLIVSSFAETDPDSMKGVRVLFIGDVADNERVKAVVEPTGVEYVFVEAK